METAPFDPDLGFDVRRDALAELLNHADSQAAVAETAEDVRRSEQLLSMADDLRRLMEPAAA